jgi:hypothetical protein
MRLRSFPIQGEVQENSQAGEDSGVIRKPCVASTIFCSVSLADLDSCSRLSGHRQHCIACETHTAALIDCQQRVPSLRWRTAGPHLGLGDVRHE